VRPTLDVDCVVDLASTAEYYAFVARLRQRGFTECRDEDAPLCRLVYAGIRVDVVATADTGIGPTNRWYRDAVVEAELHRLADDLEIRAITPVFFVATKLEAFRGRGGGDYFASHDLEDILTVLAGLPELRHQIARDTTYVARAVRAELVGLRTKEAFIDAVPAHFEGDATGQARADEILAWLASLAGA
jgi:predicted nucleotidyltransferase